MNTLKAEKRDLSIKAKRLRREGFVTGNVFGRQIKDSMPIQIAEREAERLLKKSGKGSQVMLEVDGQTYDALIKEVDYDSMKNQILEIDFQALVKGEKVHSVAEIVLLNHEKVSTGVVEQLLKEISYKALPEDLVEKVEVDTGNMHAGDTIKVKDLPIASNEKIDLMTDPETAVVTVFEVHNAEAAEAAGGEDQADK